MNAFLDTKKSVIISAPAGSGKTEKLARRYISLLEAGTEAEKILALTFTEKAAAEMKNRILTILLSEKKNLFYLISDKIPLMRIMTIHAFCRKLVARFSLELNLDPSLDVLDEFRAGRLWSESVYDALREEKNNPAIFFDYLRRKGIKGWGILFRTLDAIHNKRPYAELISGSGYKGMTAEEKSLIEIYSRCLRRYRDKKQQLHSIDFNDMEVLAYRAITSNPQWLNILYAFDEHTDHILIDEFQDTSSLQWKIIDKLTEEWRAGLGAKRSAGMSPTIFLVGDEKQSIYLFRGANVSVFHEVRKKLDSWLGPDAVYIEAQENYRSLPEIIHFSNGLFEHIMKGSPSESWRTRYSPFTPTRSGEGSVELLLIDYEKDTRQTRNKEAAFIAGKILSIVGQTDISIEPSARKCQFSDIAVLLRNRTHLSLFERQFRNNNIPYVIVGGIGFYDEPEVALLRELVSFMIDPHDDFSLFEVLRSPLFGFGESVLSGLLLRRTVSLYDNFMNSGRKDFRSAGQLLERYRSMLREKTLAVVLEEFLAQSGAWGIFHEPQRHANVKKFLRIIEFYESQGSSLYDIKENLIRSKKSNESKANVNTEHLDAVKIMTVHGAKGLQFPVVFLPSLDEATLSKSGAVFLDEVGNVIHFAYEEDYALRKKNALFVLHRAKEDEEEKRLFYVAVTRAMDHLFMSGAVRKDEAGKPKIIGKMSLIEEAFPGSVSGRPPSHDFLRITCEKDLASADAGPAVRLTSRRGTFFSGPVYTENIDLSRTSTRWLSVTEEIDIRTTHGEGWVALGSVIHRLFEELSKGIISQEALPDRIVKLLSHDPSLRSDADKYRDLIIADIKKLEDAGYLQTIILPSENAFAEMPFILQKGKKIFTGRIDRILLRDNTACLYDYKTYPVKAGEIKELAEKYRFQMDLYREACSKLFSVKTRSFILFTHGPESVEL